MPLINADVERQISAFDQVLVQGLRRMVQSNDTAFLAIMSMLAAVDTLSGWRFRDEVATGEVCPKCGRRPPGGGGRARFERFIRFYFSSEYSAHAERLYVLRCRVLHNFSPAHFCATHGSENRAANLRLSGLGNGDVYLNDSAFLTALEDAAAKYFGELRTSHELQEIMLARLGDTERGGAIFISGGPAPAPASKKSPAAPPTPDPVEGNVLAAPPSPPWHRRYPALVKVLRGSGPLLLSAIVGGVVGFCVNKVLQDRPSIVAYYRGGGVRLRGGGKSWTVAVRREPAPFTVRTKRAGTSITTETVFPYGVGPIELANEGQAATPKDLEARLECTDAFRRYWDFHLAPPDPEPLWELDGRNSLIEGSGLPVVYRYKKRVAPLGPQEKAMLNGFWVQPPSPEVTCTLVVESGIGTQSRLNLVLKFEE